MQTFEASTIPQGDVRKVLLIGPEGTGKTHFIGTCPKPIAICSFDGGYRTLAGMPGVTVFAFADENRASPKAWMEFRGQLDKILKGEVKCNGEVYKTIAIDSLTALSKYIFDHEQAVNNTTDKPAGFTPYTNTKSKLQDVVIKGVMSNAVLVCTAVIQADKDDLTGEIFMTPSTEGKFREEAGQWFDVVGFTSVAKDVATGKPKFLMDLIGDTRRKAKIRMSGIHVGGLNAVEDPSFDKLLKIANYKQPTDKENTNAQTNSKP